MNAFGALMLWIYTSTITRATDLETFRNLVGAYAIANYWEVVQWENDPVHAMKESCCQPGEQAYMDVGLADLREKEMLNSKMTEYFGDRLVYDIATMLRWQSFELRDTLQDFVQETDRGLQLVSRAFQQQISTDPQTLARAKFRNRHHIQIDLGGKRIVGEQRRTFKAEHVENDIDTEGTV